MRGGGSLVVFSGAGLVWMVPIGAAGLLGSTPLVPAKLALPLSTILGCVWDLGPLTGLEVLTEPTRALAAQATPPEIACPLALSRRFWKAAGSCFMGLSCTQKVSLLTGLRTPLVGLLNIPSLDPVSCTKSSDLFLSLSSVGEPLVPPLFGCGWLPSSSQASCWASLQISSNFSPVRGLQLCSSPTDRSPLLTLSLHLVSSPTVIPLSLWLMGPTKTSSSSSSPLKLQTHENGYWKGAWEEAFPIVFKLNFNSTQTWQAIMKRQNRTFLLPKWRNLER